MNIVDLEKRTAYLCEKYAGKETYPRNKKRITVKSTFSEEEVKALTKFLRFLAEGEIKTYKPKVVKASAAEVQSKKFPSWGIKLNTRLIIGKEHLCISKKTFEGNYCSLKVKGFMYESYNRRNFCSFRKIKRDKVNEFIWKLVEGFENEACAVRFKIFQELETQKECVDDTVRDYLIKQKNSNGLIKNRFTKKWMNLSEQNHMRQFFGMDKTEFVDLFLRAAHDKEFCLALVKISNGLLATSDVKSICELNDTDLAGLFRKMLIDPVGAKYLFEFIRRNRTDFEIIDRPEVNALYDMAQVREVIES